MTLRTSLVIAGDASGATAALAETNAALGKAEVEAKQLADAYAKADVATTKLAQAQTRAAAETTAAKAAFAAGEATLEQYNQSLLITKTELGLVASAQSAATANLRASQAAFDAASAGAVRHNVSIGQARAGYQNLGRQAQDVSVQLSGGQSIGTIFAQQGPQIADAVAMMGGRFSGLAEFLAGPWGAAIFLGTSALLTFIPTLFDTGEASKRAKEDVLDLSGSFASLAHNADVAQQALDKFYDSLPKASATAEAADKATKTLINALGVQARAARDYNNAQQALTITPNIGGGEAIIGLGQLAARKQQADQAVKTAQKDLENIRSSADAAALAAKKRDELDAIAKAEGKTPRKTRTAGAGRKGPDLEGLGLSIGNSIANIADQFSEIPAQVDKTNKAMRQLDELGHKIEKNKLPDAGALNAQLEKTRQLVNDSLNKPFDDYIKAQRESAAIDQLLIAGREDEADALKVILGLQKAQKPLSEAQQQAVLANVAAERKVTEELRVRQQVIGNYLDATRSIRSELEATLAGEGKLSNITTAFKRLQAQVLTEQIFGPIFRGLEDYVKKNTFGPAVDDLTTNTKRVSAGLSDLGDSLQNIVQRLTNARIGAGASTASGASGIGALGGSGASSSADQRDPVTGEYIDATTGERYIGAKADKAGLPKSPFAGTALALSPDAYFQMMFAKLTAPITAELDAKLGTTFFSGLNSVLSGALSGLVTAGPAGGLLGALKGIKGLPEGISAGLGKALGGAQTGTLVAGVANAVGIKLNQTGAQIGGAIGKFIPIPGGEIIGAIAGGIIGNLFSKAKTGGASVGLNQYGQAGVTGTGGNNGTLKGQANSLGGTISQGLNQIAQQLGASLGQFSVAIGMRQDYFRVSASGSVANATAKHFGSDVIYDGKDQAQAISVALANAIADGAIQGISDRVQRALTSSTDIDVALREALKVQNLELALGGIGATLKKSFSDFELQAKERLRVARQYGFDIVAVDKRNADDRLALQKKLVADQIGSLQQLIDDLTSGSLFEGSAVDQAQLIRDQIVGAKAAVDAGTEGAADKLANLLNQLNSVSKDAFGTTGGFAADRATILDTARDSIAKANQRVADAQSASDPALADTNAALDENNSQNAQILAALGITNGQLQTLINQGGGINFNALSNLARTSFN